MSHKPPVRPHEYSHWNVSIVIVIKESNQKKRLASAAFSGIMAIF